MQGAWFDIWGTRSRMPQIKPGTAKQIDKTHNFKKESLKINNVEQDAFVKKAEDKTVLPTPHFCVLERRSLKDDIIPHIT